MYEGGCVFDEGGAFSYFFEGAGDVALFFYEGDDVFDIDEPGDG